MSSPYAVLGDRPIDQWRVTELKDELKKRKLITKGLKEDLVKRLDEAIRKEEEEEDLNKAKRLEEALRKEEEEEDLKKADSLGSVDQSEHLLGNEMAEIATFEKSEVTVTVGKEVEIDLHAQISGEQESGSLNDREGVVLSTNHGDSGDNKADHTPNLDIHDGPGLVEEEQSVSGSAVTGLEGNQTAHVIDEKTIETVSEITETRNKGEGLLDNGIQSESSDEQAQMDTRTQNDPLDGGSLLASKDTLSDMNNLVSEVKSVEGGVSEGGQSLQVDVLLPQANVVSVEETGSGNVESVDVSPQKDDVYVDLSSSGKVNLDQSPSDDFMDEDVAETKQIAVTTDSEEPRANAGKIKVAASEDEVLVDIVGEDVSAQKASDMPSVKRKLNDQISDGNTDAGKKQRRWIAAAGLKVPEAQVDVISTTPKNVVQQPFKRSFSYSSAGEVPKEQVDGISTTPKNVVQQPFKRSFSYKSANEEVPKERVVPPSAKPPTNSLRIDRFLRPFTLKAVQDLLGKTGTVNSFWMDQIKTHCYVSYSSIDEAIETRNAVYNLQWPTNGGRQLVADFVDPQEVKLRLEPPPPKAPEVAVKPVANILPLPSPRPNLPIQQLPQQFLPPPPLVRGPVPQPAREHFPVRERLNLPPPPPPPVAEKTEAPILTLDDLFRKTRATPRIYYLPLSDEQVEAKLQAQGKSVRQ